MEKRSRLWFNVLRVHCKSFKTALCNMQGVETLLNVKHTHLLRCMNDMKSFKHMSGWFPPQEAEIQL